MRWYRLTDETWRELERLAAARDELSRRASNTRPWNPRFNFLGAIGERLYEEITGLPMNREVRIRDGGSDFPGVDVKATPHYRSPRLLRHADDPLKAPVYCLVAVDLDRRRTRLAGYATRAMLAAARVEEYGYGPTRTLDEKQLLSADALVPRIFAHAA